jgi:hydroxymethylbilane synthase
MRVGTRASALALAQARSVAALLPEAQLVPIVTSGDRGLRGGDKSRWVAELERALLSGEVDLAVHSAKDVPAELADGLQLAGAPPRADPEDVVCGAGTLSRLAPGSRVGTSSIRRIAQLRAAREDLELVALRGNVDTRLRKLEDGELDAVVLARAGLQRLGREDAIVAVLDPERFVPAPGQGTLALQARRGDARVLEAVAGLGDRDALTCLLAERALARALEASCSTPLGAMAAADGGRLVLRAWVGVPDGSQWAFDELCGGAGDPEGLGREVAARLIAAGAAEILAQCEVSA